MTSDEIRNRIASVCAGQPFGFHQATTPFSFDLQPSGDLDQVFRIEQESLSVVGGFNFTEDRTDLVTIWLARKYFGDPDATYTRLVTDIGSIRSAVMRDGAQVSGEYVVTDGGGGFSVQRGVGQEFAVLRLALPVNFEMQC